MPKPEFKERKEGGDIGEWIVFTALQKGIIPNRGSIRMFTVDPKDKDSIQYNLVNGDIGFLGMNLAECRVDVKSTDCIYAKSLKELDSGCYYFLNAKPNKRSTGLPFMFKLDEAVRNWISSINCEKFQDEDGKLSHRVLKHKLTELFPKHIYEFDEKEFCKHRTECLIEKGLMEA